MRCSALPITLEKFKAAKGGAKPKIPYEKIKQWTQDLMVKGEVPSEKDLREKWSCSIRTVGDRAVEAGDKFSYRTIDGVKYFSITQK